jgi:ABC-type uncharacterized transport system permease subunit
LFDNPKTAALVTSVFYFITALVALILEGDHIIRITKLALSILFPPCAMANGAITMSRIEFGSIGITFDTWDDRYKQFSVIDSIVCMTISQVVYLIIGLYLEAVWPSQYGENKKPWFCITPIFSCCCRRKQ